MIEYSGAYDNTKITMLNHLDNTLEIWGKNIKQFPMAFQFIGTLMGHVQIYSNQKNVTANRHTDWLV